ncbi:MAG: aldo/keto reductase [Clostridiales bacterium]|nr:aldo/keto reductase [Clostridiales bacterium]
MKYRKGSSGEELSVLGYGGLRFTKKGNTIDKEKAEREIMTAIGGGVNYLDTAYTYNGSEALIGEILERNQCRDQVYLATKLPLFLIRNPQGMEKVFQEQLRRLRTDHIDYYLMHMLNDTATWKRFQDWGIEEWIREKKNSGQIGHIGFSYHGSHDEFCHVADAYPWEFCQIQYNYMDEYFQAGRQGLQYAHSKGMHVVIMEPLRGGRLVQLLPSTVRDIFQREGERSPAAWAFRWLYDQPEVTTVLSGMNTLEMVEENLRIAEEADVHCMTEREHAVLREVRRELERTVLVKCTGCAYCMPCPQGVDIPGTFRCYNMTTTEGIRSAKTDYRRSSLMRRNPSSASRCIGCGKCEKHCPQEIPIREELKKAAGKLEGPMYQLWKTAIHLGRFY